MIKILGSGKFLPKHILSNQDLESIVDTSDEWITKRTGISSRHVVTSESVAHMAIEASVLALKNADIASSEIDLVICGTLGGDFVLPSVACLVAGHFDLKIPAFDINAACSGYVYALDVAVAYITSGKAEKVLLVGVDNMSRYVDYTNRNTCVLFGDGAGALVLEKGSQLKAIKLTSQGGADLMNIPNSQGNAPFLQKYDLEPYLYMDGPEVYKFAIKALEDQVRDVVAMAGLDIKDIDWLLPHQANFRIIETATKSLGINMDKVLSNIKDCGNTSTACLPSLLHDGFACGKFKKGDIIVMCTFGGGLTTGAAVLEI